MIDAGITATTAMHGANAPVDKTDWSPLAGKAVLIWPDRDKPGFGYAEAASQAVLMAGATSCAILLPPDDKPEGWDAFDALAEGFDVTGFIATGPRLAVQSLDDERDPFGDAGVAGDADSQTACDSDATEEYFEEEDTIGEFLDEECQQHPQAREAVADVFERWRARAEKRSEYIGTSRWLVQQLLRRGFTRGRTSSGAKAIQGLSLKPKDYGSRSPYLDD